ncbi:uncharacterized protein LDX57_008209 [Aspergillus melleus]|uniref:uncharacterized protein n=1 Tax=Aspergillus melleus TaxID=138277 RepID=UPI001E8EC47F|nr:uncharacterized protein LDX57_008209 [Aspergillus melleus]KAH8430545.1 hypothetical protein LDX57_008209 [Aspergillus melleus]
MEKRISEMKKLSGTEARKVVERILISFVDEDGRLSDVTRIIGKKNAGDEERLVLCLAQRALAEEYTQWELKVRGLKKTRVQELAERLSNANPQSGHVAQYVRECRRFKSEDDAVRSIRYGIKQHLQEKLLSDKLSDGTACGGIELGIAFAYPDFFSMTFDQQEEFAELLASEGSAAHILNFLLEQSRWISECQAVYNGKMELSVFCRHVSDVEKIIKAVARLCCRLT